MNTTTLIECPRCYGKCVINSLAHVDGGICYECNGEGEIEEKEHTAATVEAIARRALADGCYAVGLAADDFRGSPATVVAAWCKNYMEAERERDAFRRSNRNDGYVVVKSAGGKWITRSGSVIGLALAA